MRTFSKILTLTVSLMTILIYSVEAQSKKPTPNSLDDQSLCDMATYGMSDSKLWKLGTYIVYVNEAKSRGLECGVKKLLQGDIRDLKSSEVKLYLTHLGIFDDELSDDVNEELYSAIQKLMTLEGFAYDDPRSPEAFTFVAETYAQRIDEDARKKYKCDAIRTKKLPNLNMPNDLYYCELSLDKADVQKLEISELCKLATHQSTQGKRWNVGPKSIYAEEAIRRGSKCDVSSDSEKDLSVAQVQTRLHNLGYNPGPIDDAWGRKTSTALKMFMNSLGIEDIDPESLKARSILYDFYDQEFEQVVDSSVPCSEITNDFETDFGPCVVIAHYNETSATINVKDTLTAIWDKAGYPHLRKRKDNLLEVVIWGPDMPRKAQTVHDLPGLAHMANFPVNIKKIFLNHKGIKIKNKSRTMPLSVRRYELNDMNNDGIEELFLLGSREDGRKGGNFRKIDKVYANMIDYNFIYDFEKDAIKTFGKPTFSHDYGIHDFDQDGFKDILDITISEHKGLPSYLYCDGKTLNCFWKLTDQFLSGQAFVAYDPYLDKVFMNARCGKRHTNDGFYGKLTLCWFTVKKSGSSVKFDLVNKFEWQPKFNAKIRFKGFSGDITQKVPQAWKIEGYSVDKRVKKSAGGTATAFEDLDNDGDLDMITYRKDYLCVKKDKARNYYTYADCDKSLNYDYIFSQNGGKFKLSQIIEGGTNDATRDYVFFDLNDDGYVDIIPRGVMWGYCPDYYADVLINKGNGKFERNTKRYSGRYGCEFASNFFTVDKERYRIFLFKPQRKETTWNDFDVYLAVEYLGSNPLTVMPDEKICVNATYFKNCATKCEEIWNPLDEYKIYVEEAQKRGLSCGIQTN